MSCKYLEPCFRVRIDELLIECAARALGVPLDFRNRWQVAKSVEETLSLTAQDFSVISVLTERASVTIRETRQE